MLKNLTIVALLLATPFALAEKLIKVPLKPMYRSGEPLEFSNEFL